MAWTFSQHCVPTEMVFAMESQDFEGDVCIFIISFSWHILFRKCLSTILR